MIKPISDKTKELFMSNLIHAANIDINHGGTNQMFNILYGFHVEVIELYQETLYD